MSCTVEHLLLESSHPWHTVPGAVVSTAVFVPLFIVALPVMLVDSSDVELTAEGNTTFQAVVVASLIPGGVVAAVFYVALYPLEWVFPTSTAPEGTESAEPPPSVAPPAGTIDVAGD